MRLCHNRMFFVRAYLRETQEIDAHDRAFSFFRGACTRGIIHGLATLRPIDGGGFAAHKNRIWNDAFRSGTGTATMEF